MLVMGTLEEATVIPMGTVGTVAQPTALVVGHLMEEALAAVPVIRCLTLGLG